MTKRPTFLTILCFLTFFWNTQKVLDNMFIYQNPDKYITQTKKSMEQSMSMFSVNIPKESQVEFQKNITDFNNRLTPDNIRTSNLVSIFSAGLLLMGAVWMFYQQKRGFWTYMLGSLVGIIAPVVIFGGQMSIGFGFITLFASALFTGLYAKALMIRRAKD